MNKSLTLKLTACGIFSALSTVAFVIESLFPPLFLPGVRMGVSNVFILLCIILLGGKYGYFTLLVKVVLGSLLSGNISAIIYSLPAGIISLTVEFLLLKLTKNVSIVAISIAGAVLNTLIQNLTFCLVTKTIEYLSYSPYLALGGVLGGLIIGVAVYLIIKIIPKNFFLEC